SQVFDSHGVRRRERFPAGPDASRQLHAKDLNCWRLGRPYVVDRVHKFAGRVHEFAVTAPLKREISRPERGNRLTISTFDRKELPRAGETEDGVVVADGRFAGGLPRVRG